MTQGCNCNSYAAKLEILWLVTGVANSTIEFSNSTDEKDKALVDVKQ